MAQASCFGKMPLAILCKAILGDSFKFKAEPYQVYKLESATQDSGSMYFWVRDQITSMKL